MDGKYDKVPFLNVFYTINCYQPCHRQNIPESLCWILLMMQTNRYRALKDLQRNSVSYSTMTNSCLFSSFLPMYVYRYDVRATLESAPAEANDSYMNRMDGLSAAEQQAEMMAEKERYYSLYTNEVEEEMYKGKQQTFTILNCAFNLHNQLNL